MINLLGFAILLCGLLSWRLSLATELEEIVWVKNDAPPFYILSGPAQGRGLGDRVQAMIEESLPQYSHRSTEMPLARLNLNWANGLPLCFSTMIYQPGESDDYLLSIPNLYYLPHGIITRTEIAKRISPEGKPVALAMLLKQKNMMMGKILGRSFGGIVDTILDQQSEHLVLLERAGADETLGILKMLVKRRFDFVIDYQYVLNYHATNTSIKNRLAFIPIAENSGSGIVGAIGCSNSVWGRQVISDINQAIVAIRDRAEYKSIIQGWLILPGDELKYWLQYKQKVLFYKAD